MVHVSPLHITSLVSDGLLKTTIQQYSGSKKKGKGKTDSSTDQEEGHGDQEPIKIFLTFKRYIYDPEKKMKQT